MSELNKKQKIEQLSTVLYSFILDDGCSANESCEDIFDYIQHNQINNDLISIFRAEFEENLENLCNKYAEILVNKNFTIKTIN